MANGYRKKFFIPAAIVAAATMGEGVFALPYVIQESGWLIAFICFIALIAVVSIAHALYARTLAAVNGEDRLLGLARTYFGAAGFWVGFFAIIIGLLLGFVAYLVLGARLLVILSPALSPAAALWLFWFLLACLIWASEGKIAGLEAVGIALIACAIFFIYFSGHPAAALSSVPLAMPQNFFLPFGAILFSLAGWTSVEQVYELERGGSGSGNGADGGANNGGANFTAGGKWAGVFWAFFAGTAFAALLYWFFAFGVLGDGARVAMDTVSGIGAWPIWRKDILAVLGLLSMAVVSLPIARELRGALEKDLAWNSIAARAAIILLPLAVVLSGFNNFLTIVSVAGGVFISAQYLLIISVGRRTLALSSREKLLLDLLSVVFLCAAIYSIGAFIVR